MGKKLPQGELKEMLFIMYSVHKGALEKEWKETVNKDIQKEISSFIKKVEQAYQQIKEIVKKEGYSAGK